MLHDDKRRPMDLELFDLEAFPRGRCTRAWVTLAHDALGEPLRVPILVARGEKPGPLLGLTSALHGNEINGIPVVHRLFERLDPQKMKGSVVAVAVVNLPGFTAHTRSFSDGRDLNHIMPGREDGNHSELYTHRLLDRIVRRFDVLVDLHTASFGRVNSLYVRADMTNETAARMSHLVRPQIIAHKQASDGTLRGAATALGIPSITVEIGNPQRFQPEYIRSTLVGIRRLLANFGIIARRALVPGLPAVVCERSYWIFAPHGGLLEVLPGLTESLEAGQKVARITDIFGDLIEEYSAPEAGIVIGKSVNPVGMSGARVLHVGIPCAADSPLLAQGEG